MSVRPWRELVTPHSDVLRGTFQQSEFAADISRVHSGTATEEYRCWLSITWPQLPVL